MSISELKRQFRCSAIGKPACILAMLACHDALIEYAEFIRGTDIRAIEIGEAGVVRRGHFVRITDESPETNFPCGERHSAAAVGMEG